ncbi:11471_t:CDS:2, partial [Racocetra fulgida]
IDKSELDALPKDDILTSLLATTVMVNIYLKEIKNYTGYVTDLIDDSCKSDELNNNSNNVKGDRLCDNEEITEYINLHDPIESASELRSSGMIYIYDIPISERNRTLKLLEKMLQESFENKRSVVGYDTQGNDIEMLIDQEDFDDDNLNPLNLYMIMGSGLHDTHDNYESQVQPSREEDDDLIQKWQETITLRKQVEQLTEDQKHKKDN